MMKINNGIRSAYLSPSVEEDILCAMPPRPAKIQGASSPIGALIEEAREALDLSQNEAAARCGFSGTRWRHIIQGRRGKSDVIVQPEPATWARMALVVGLSPGDVSAVRPDVARELRKVAPTRPEPSAPVAHARLDHAAPKLVVPQLVALLTPLREMSDSETWQTALRQVGLAPPVDA